MVQKPKTVLVAGAAGFIGSNLCHKLLAKYRLIGIDNYISGSFKNIAELQKSSNFKFIKIDICRPINLPYPIDEIYDLACPASPVDFIKYPLEILETCSQGVKNLLDLARKFKAKFIHASTSEIYGDPLVHPQKESYWGNVNPIGLRSCYDEGKRFAESLIINYAKNHHIDTKIVRIFNTYGPRMRTNDGRVISNFINQALTARPLTVYGNGQQTRSFCYVDDLVEGLIKMMDSPFCGPFNLGNPREFTIKQLVEQVIKLTHCRSKIIFKVLPADDPQQRCPDITLAHTHLNWEPKTSLKTGLTKTVAYFKINQ